MFKIRDSNLSPYFKSEEDVMFYKEGDPTLAGKRKILRREQKVYWYMHPFKASFFIMQGHSTDFRRPDVKRIFRDIFRTTFRERMDYVARQCSAPNPLVRKVANSYLVDLEKAITTNELPIKNMELMLKLLHITGRRSELGFLAGCYILDFIEILENRPKALETKEKSS